MQFALLAAAAVLILGIADGARSVDTAVFTHGRTGPAQAVQSSVPIVGVTVCAIFAASYALTAIQAVYARPVAIRKR